MTTLEQSRTRAISPELIFDFDIYNDPGIRRDLHHEYARLLDQAPPIFWTPANGGHWMVTRYDAITSVVLDTTHFSNAQSEIPAAENANKLIPVNYDPPENMPYRKILMPYFSPKAVKDLEARIDFQANQIVDTIKEKGRCEFVKEVAAPFPITVFMILMGLPLERYDELRRMVENFFECAGTAAQESASATIVSEMSTLIDARRADPKEDLVSYLVASDLDGRPLTQDELTNMCFLLLLGGLDTVTNMLTFTTHRLAREPELQDRLIRDHSLMPALVEEGLRLFGVVNVPRVVKKDIDLGGANFRVGDIVLCTLPLAGRDDTKNAHPARFDIDRAEKKHLTFSTGAHLCLGHFLARSELKKMFEVWMTKIGRFRLGEQAEFRYRGGTVMALESLHLEWDAPAG